VPDATAEKDTKASTPKPDTSEGEKIAEKAGEKPVAEPVPEPPAAPVTAKGGASPKAGAPTGAGAKAAAQPKLSVAEKKKLADAQKREEVQRAAEQSYEAGLQFIRESRDADAIKAFRQTVKLSPDSADAWLRLAYLCEKEGKTEEAMRAFKEAKRLWSF
jgi:Flp pilus assembly protein TadD